jgi:7-cyano-7-deazaguanine reductase
LITDAQRPGEAAIERAELEALPNPSPRHEYTVELSFPEFTCKCPRSGYPDFATITLTYVPDQSIVELRSWKLYLNRYRDQYIFHEAVTNQILDDFVAAIRPARAWIVADWNVRGNVKTIVRAAYPSPEEP